MSAAVAQLPLAAAPVVRFVGGKTQLLPEILPRLPLKISTYFEPFVGGGAVFFALANEGRFKRAVLGDSNLGLVNLYIQIRDKPSAVIEHLRAHDQKHGEDYYYEQRARNREEGPAGAARFIYLQKTNFNGLYRVSAAGELNSPFGHHKKKPNIINADGIRAASRVLKEKDVKIVHGDFEKTVARAGVGDACYMDPVYLPIPSASSFTAYDSDGFTIADHERLADCVVACVKRGANVLLSNSDTPESRRIFTEGRGQWLTEKVSARRSINSDGKGRGAVWEILVTAPKRARRVVK